MIYTVQEDLDGNQRDFRNKRDAIRHAKKCCKNFEDGVCYIDISPNSEDDIIGDIKVTNKK